MSDVDLFRLPVELLHRIFDYLEAQAIWSVRRVCKQLYSITSTYDRFHLNVNSQSKRLLKLFSRWISPECIVSLIFDIPESSSYFSWCLRTNSEDNMIRLFISLFAGHRFTRLRSLVINRAYDGDIDFLSHHLNTNSLESLSIHMCGDRVSSTIAFINTILSQNCIRKLYFNNSVLIINDMPWPDHCKLEHLILNTCGYNRYLIVLNDLLNLKIFVIDEWHSYNFGFSTDLLACKHRSLLTSLTIKNCTLPMEHIETLLSRTPALVHLKLISRKRAFDSIFDGYNWEQFILNRLPQLNRFEYFFSFIHKTNDYMKILNRVIASFQTPFWLQQKHWYTICSYAFESQTFELHTTTIHVTDSNNLIKFEKLAETNTYRLVGQPSKTDRTKTCTVLDLSNKTIDDTAVKFLSLALQHDKTLNILNLAGNQIGDIGAEHLATALLYNTTLVELNLRRNQIGRSGAQYFFKLQQNNTTLKKLELNENADSICTIVEIAHRIRYDKTLNSLNLAKRQIGDLEAQYLAEALRINNRLVSLDLRNNNISEIGIELIADALRNNSILSRIYLSGNPRQLGTVATTMQRMKCDMANYTLDFRLIQNSNFFVYLQSLTILKVQGCQIGNKGVQYLTDIFQHNNTIIAVNLDNNEIDDNGIKYLADVLRANEVGIFCGQTLTTLSLSYNRISDNGIKHLVDAIPNNTTLTIIDLEGNQIEDKGAEYIAVLLQNNKTLISLNLQKNRIGDMGAQHFREALKLNKTLLKLTLRNNQSNSCTIVQMEHEIKHEMTCTTTDWTGHQIGKEKLECLSAALKTNYTTIILILDNNHIGNDGIKHIADGLLKNTTLQELSVRNNRIGNEGVEYIANVLKENMTLTTLNLSNNLISDDGAKHLADAIQKNTKLIKLNLENNRIGDSGAQQVATALNINTVSYFVGEGYICVLAYLLIRRCATFISVATLPISV
ncbi:unnamed protein product [Rotaria magnacalcarata]|uniref:F-box domain-containing protein n=1 Tax=Rotaria magnacalcarata TaxID=392030 RepID=A0A8S2KQU8_9BILA|nr:unnamed protein product [Rotaria magnacalcarata]